MPQQFLQNYKYSVERVEEQKPRAFYYESLYPNKANRHRMMNRHVVDKLREHGDSLKQARTVNHWVYFSSAESRDLFKEKVRKDGFRMEDEAVQDGKHSLIISRKDYADLHSISGVTDYLVNAAQAFDGEYDGWESKVINEKENFLGGLKRMFKPRK
ncbi:ribonuclease E inhibitor RraB [Paenibacillus sp. P26]|nr:ribonuclease E inhibitor RraB [Paenibacillus sp. P26]UUZ96856.1 ribonuclease E inhibitor RraB [Paenibacillus sp. P25]